MIWSPQTVQKRQRKCFIYFPRFLPSDLHWGTQHQPSIFTVNDVVFTFTGVATQTGSNYACSLRQGTWSINEKKNGVSAGMEMTRKYRILPSRERKFCSRKYLHVLENHICYWIVQVSPESSDREVQKYLLGLWNIWWHMPFLLIYEHPIWYWIIILTRANISYGFFHKIYRRCPPR